MTNWKHIRYLAENQAYLTAAVAKTFNHATPEQRARIAEWLLLQRGKTNTISSSTRE